MKTIICKHCDMVSQYHDIQLGYMAKCHRCYSVIYKAKPIKASRMLALSLTALMLSIPAYSFPLISIHLLGITEDTNLLQGAVMMINTAPVVSFVVLFCAVVAPTLLAACIAFSSFCIISNKRPKILIYVLTLTRALMHWSMLEVYLASLLVSALKLMTYTDLYFGSGLLFFVTLLILNITIISEYSNAKHWEYLRNE